MTLATRPALVIAPTQAAVDAAQAFAERTGTCVQSALDALPQALREYCHCTGCLEDGAAQCAAETWAEGAWLRHAESQGQCYGAFLPGGGCACC